MSVIISGLGSRLLVLQGFGQGGFTQACAHTGLYVPVIATASFEAC